MIVSIRMKRIHRKVAKSWSHVDTIGADEDGRDGGERGTKRTRRSAPPPTTLATLAGKGGKVESKTGSYILKGRRDSTAWPVSRLDPPKSGASGKGPAFIMKR